MTGHADHPYMAQALRLARRGLYSAAPNPRVGCVLVRGGEVVGSGWHARTGGPHAEVIALEQAGPAAAGATAYVTLEPCSHHGRTPPCAEALIGAGVSRVVIAMRDPNPQVDGGGISRLEAAGIEVVTGVMEAQAMALNRGYLSRRQRSRPFVRSKLAVSIDGRTALADGHSQWISSAASRADGHRLRAMSCGVLTGIGTVLADNPSLDVRRDDLGEIRPPDTLVVDSRLRLPADARMLHTAGQVRVFCVDDPAQRRARLEAAGAIVETVPELDGRVDLAAVLRRLAELEYNELLVEAGETLNGALLNTGLIDELVIYMASHVMGSDARGMFGIPALAAMEDRMAFSWVEARRIGADLRLVLSRSDH